MISRSKCLIFEKFTIFCVIAYFDIHEHSDTYPASPTLYTSGRWGWTRSGVFNESSCSSSHISRCGVSSGGYLLGQSPKKSQHPTDIDCQLLQRTCALYNSHILIVLFRLVPASSLSATVARSPNLSSFARRHSSAHHASPP